MNDKPIDTRPTQHSVLRVGNLGSAYDQPGTRRAFTYRDQPGNVTAWKLGNAAHAAALASAGDPIDRGLALLKALQDAGFGVFEIESHVADAS